MHCSEKPALSPFMLESAQLSKVNVTVVVIKSFFSTEMLAKIHFNVKIFYVYLYCQCYSCKNYDPLSLQNDVFFSIMYIYNLKYIFVKFYSQIY